MAKFLRLGFHHSNASGYTSKAWTVRRVGSTVLLKWGSVEVRGVGHGRRIYWASPPRRKTLRCSSEKRARDYVRRAITRRHGHQYERLPERVRIQERPVRHQVKPDRVLATVLFIDIVRSTEKAALLGDRRWTEVLNHYYAAVRRELRSYHGREVTTAGDGVLATFDGPAKAIRCAAAIGDAVRTLGLEIRAGLHTGECEVIGDTVGGIAVHIGARVVAIASANEVLVSSTVRELVVGSGIRFKDGGVHKLRGVPDEWRLYLVESSRRRTRQFPVPSTKSRTQQG
jgi:class 3 adenylate cyclase